MKLTRRQLRKLINEAMMGPVEPESFYAVTVAKGIPGISNPRQPIILKKDTRAGKYTLVKIPGVELRSSSSTVSHSPSASYDGMEISRHINNYGEDQKNKALYLQLAKFLDAFRHSGGFQRAIVQPLGGGETYQKVLQMNNIFNTGEAELQLSADQYKTILQATGDPNLAQGMEDFRRETAPRQQQKLDMPNPSYDLKTGKALNESLSRGSLLRRRYRRY